MKILTSIIIASALAFSTYAADQEQGTTIIAETYKPGLGDIMGMIQLRHAKLWFAGKAHNWKLASYELDELQEGFDGAAEYHPNFKDNPIAPMITSYVNQPLSSLKKAINIKNETQFVKAYDHLSNACTACHKATGYGFISIARPTLSPMSNQRFEPKR